MRIQQLMFASKKTSMRVALVALCMAGVGHAAVPPMIELPAGSPFPESVTSAADGTLYVSSLSNGGIVRIAPDGTKPEIFIAPGAFGSAGTFGVNADSKTQTLWVCSNKSDRFGPKLADLPEGAFLLAFDLAGGQGKARYALPAAGALCNDIAVGGDGSVYVTNTRGTQIFRLRPGGDALESWVDDPALQGGLDGIAFGADGNLYVNTFQGGALFRIAVKDGRAGAITSLALSRPLTHPDALKAVKSGFVMVEGAGPLDHVTIAGDRAVIDTVKPFAGPTGVTVAGDMVWVAEGQLDHLGDRDKGLALPSFQLRPLPLAALYDAGAANAGIALPPGFSASLFADRIGHVRQMTVGADGTLYANSWSGRYYRNDTPPAGGFLLALKDSAGSGHADHIVRFGGDRAEGSNGGTGIALFEGKLYAEVNDLILSYDLPVDGLSFASAKPDIVVSGLPLTGDHPMHPFVIAGDGSLFVDVASASNSCQPQNRMPDVKGDDPCRELVTRGGIWRYDARKSGQLFSPDQRYATGLRNGEGFAFDGQGRLFVTQHGRDQLSANWGKLYTTEQSVALPAEEVVEVTAGADYGWPYCYFDAEQGRLVLAPEYGGDGGKAVGRCARKQGPAASFPAHWAPNDLKFYQGAMFPKAYRGGAFVAFHGSWNRAPLPQGGYNIVFQPMADGKAAGPFVVFADGFAGPSKDPAGAAHRPSGLAVAPDGALYISDDKNGRIWRVTYQGDADAPLQGAVAANASTPSGGRPTIAAVAPPTGSNPAQIARGDALFHGEAGGACAGCHGEDAGGSPTGANLVAGKWLWGKGSLADLRRVIAKGVAKPKEHTGAMPPKGGTDLSKADIDALAAYVWTISRKKLQGAP